MGYRPLHRKNKTKYKNGIKTDNRIENLELIAGGKHTSLHNRGNKYGVANRIDMSNRRCFVCQGTETWRRHWFKVENDFDNSMKKLKQYNYDDAFEAGYEVVEIEEK